MKLHSENANKILALYYNRVNHIIKPLAETDRQEITMELASHIYESMARNQQGDDYEYGFFVVPDTPKKRIGGISLKILRLGRPRK